MKNTIGTISLLVLLSIASVGCSSSVNGINNEEQQQVKQDEEVPNKIVYQESQYGFNFSLPLSWEGYTILSEKWEGLSLHDSEGEKVIETGPMIIIRHPEWSSENQRQDIPIMIFTLSQWDSLQKEEFHIGAAPIGPSELGRNNQYVFALPARYNFAFPTGYEEVEEILKSKPLIVTEVN
jgi:hypothetical protein